MSQGTPPAGNRHEMRIGIWGATGSGKTTYLGALKLAGEQTNRPDVSWSVVPAEGLSTDVLTEYAGVLANDKRFPEGTFATVPLQLNLLGERHFHQAARRPGTARRPPPRAERVEFGLELLDLSGRLFDDRSWIDPATLAEPEQDDDDLAFDVADPSEPSGVEADLEQVLRHLTDCQGILYLFDPLRDEAEGDAFRYFNAIMSHVQARTLRAGRMLGPKLPHHVAVCVTKFDDRQVLTKALGARGLEKLQGSSPPIRVDSDVAAAYVDALARERPDSTARLVRDAIRAAVLKERLKFFATSSVGFWLGPEERFDQDDFGNVLEDGGPPRIRGSVRPMNVLEPMVWLASHIRKAHRAGLQT